MLPERDLFSNPQPPPLPPPAPAPMMMREPAKVALSLPNNPSQKNLRKDTEDWIRANPAVAQLFLRFARELAAKGKPFGIGLITERVRYEVIISTSPSKFKINNNWRSYLARWLITMDPSLEKWMKFREVKY
jgi:hypothetical protein